MLKYKGIAIDSDNVILINYFKQADKDLEYKRWGKLPATLDMIFNHWVKNNQKCSINKNNKLDKNSECFSRLGIIQKYRFTIVYYYMLYFALRLVYPG